MGRPRKYLTDAARQRAYRARMARTRELERAYLKEKRDRGLQRYKTPW